MNKKHTIISALLFLFVGIVVYIYYQFKEQRIENQVFIQDCKNSTNIYFRNKYIEIYFDTYYYTESQKKLIEEFDLLHIRNNKIIDTLEYEKDDDYYKILQFDLRSTDTLRIQFSAYNKIDIYGFKNEIEYVYPNKIKDCNFQSYIIDSIEYRVEDYCKVNIMKLSKRNKTK